MKEKLVSVVIPTYSRPLFLKRAIDSVLSQTYSNIEIIVVDDNNPDSKYRLETERVMKEYANNTKVNYIKHRKNKNGSAARNTGWKHSSGEYITFVDDDDELANEKIREQVCCLEKLSDDWGMCYTKYELLKEKGRNQLSCENRSGYLYIDALMRTLFLGSGSNLLLRKKIVDEIGGYDESFERNQDIEFLVRVCERYKIAFINKVLLTIHQEGERKKRTLEENEIISRHYLDVFSSRINALSEKDRRRVMSVIALERARTGIADKNIGYAFRLLIDNKVNILHVIKYVIYLINRTITGKSYGFYIK